MPAQALIVCEHCDTVHRRVELAPGAAARCHTCGGPLYHRSRLELNAMLALTLAGIIVFAVANAYPLVTLSSQGIRNEAALWQMVASAWNSHIALVAAIAALTVFFFPLLQLALYAYILLPLSLHRVPRGFAAAMHLLRQLRPWSMVEVFLIGVLVTIIKIGSLADVVLQPGIWSFGVLTALLTALAGFDTRELWQAADETQR